MGTRHDSIGIKQVIPYEWMQKAASLVLAGLAAQGNSPGIARGPNS